MMSTIAELRRKGAMGRASAVAVADKERFGHKRSESISQGSLIAADELHMRFQDSIDFCFIASID